VRLFSGLFYDIGLQAISFQPTEARSLGLLHTIEAACAGITKTIEVVN
jgi:hypothetical protein